MNRAKSFRNYTLTAQDPNTEFGVGHNVGAYNARGYNVGAYSVGAYSFPGNPFGIQNRTYLCGGLQCGGIYSKK